VLSDSLLRWAAGRDVGLWRPRLFVHANTGLIQPLWAFVTHRIAALSAERIVGRDLGSTLRAIHDSPVPYQNSRSPHCG
jgi:hypothetical protein